MATSTATAIGAPSIVQGVTRLFSARGQSTLTEVTLANNRRADVLALSASGDLTIVEVKSCRNDFMTDSKWQDYLPFCDRYFFAVDEAFPVDILPDETGLIIADAYGGEIIRNSFETRLAPARRKAMILKMAHLAANRLNQTQV